MSRTRLSAALLAAAVSAVAIAACGSSESVSSGGKSSGEAGINAHQALVNAAHVTPAHPEGEAATLEQAAAGSGKGLKLGYIALSEASPFVHLVSESMKEQASRSGATLDVCNAEESPAVALNCAKTFKSEGVQGYLNFQSDVEAAKSICEAGPPVPVIAIDIEQKPCEKSFMGASDSFAGELGGRALGLYFKQRFKCEYEAYISLQGYEVGAVNTQRMGGIDRGFESECGPIKNERKQQGDRLSQARAAFANILTTLPGAKRIIVVGINEEAIEGALAAAKDVGREKDLFVSAQGATPATYCTIKKNEQWISDVAYFPEHYGEIGIPNLIKLVKGEGVARHLFMPHKIINATNIEQYYHLTGC